MPVEFTLERELTNPELFKIYELFCQAYEITPDAIDKDILNARGMETVRESGGMDWRPFMGAKFFGTEHQADGKASYRFHGYNDHLGDRDIQLARGQQFQELVLAYVEQLQAPDETHVYEVGILSDKVKVRAPSAEAAALFYGMKTGGNMQLGAVVYTEDGEEYEGNTVPFGEWQFKPSLTPEEEGALEAKLAEVKPQLDHCEFVQ